MPPLRLLALRRSVQPRPPSAAANGDDAETEAFLERLQSAIDEGGGGGVSQSVSAGGTRGSLSNTRLQSVAL